MAENAEGTVDWAGAKDFFTGTEVPAMEDATPKEETTQDPQLVEVKLKGRTLKLSAEDAAAVEAFRREGRERDGRIGGENAAMKERLARLEGRIEEQTRAPRESRPSITRADPKLVETDFAAWQVQQETYYAAKMAEMKMELEVKYEMDRTQEREQAQEAARVKSWADTFYSDHDYLDNPRLRGTVQTVYVNHQNDILAAGAVKDQHTLLASLVDDELVELRKVGKTNTRQPPRLEGSSTPSTRMPKDDERKPVTAASWVAQKRAQMRGDSKMKGN